MLDSHLFQLKTKSTWISLSCLLTGLEHREELRLFAILSDHETLAKRMAAWDHPSLANTTLVPSATRHAIVSTSSCSWGSETSDQPNGGPPPTNQILVSSRMICIQQLVSTRGTSDRASKLIWASWRPGTNTVSIQPGLNDIAGVRREKVMHFAPIREI